MAEIGGLNGQFFESFNVKFPSLRSNGEDATLICIHSQA